MKFFSTLLLFFIILSGCGNSKSFKVAEVRSIEFEYDTNADLNYGGSLKATPYALLLNGEKVDISKNRKFKFHSKDLKKPSSSTSYSVVKTPASFTDDTLKIQLLLNDKNETFSVTKTILLNYRGTLNVNLNGDNGSNGENQKDQGSSYILRDGKDGEDGTNGENAKDALDYNLYNWKENEVFYFYIISTDSSEILTYKSADKNELSIQLNGGNGGKGGDGGNAGDGKNGKITSKGKSKNPGNGGDGGNGSNGGNGGKSGSLTVFIHGNTSGIKPSILLSNKGGLGGDPGTFGKAGKPGDPLEGQTPGVPGVNGAKGKRGSQGVNGMPASSVVVNFDYARYL